MNKYYIITGLTFVCFLVGSQIWPIFMGISLDEINSPSVILDAKGFNTLSSGSTLFIFTVGLIPLLHFGVNKISQINSVKEKLLSLFIILLFGLIAWQGRVLTVILKLQKDVSLTKSLGPDIKTAYFTKELRPELYLTLGITIGAILGVIIFRKKKGNIA